MQRLICILFVLAAPMLLAADADDLKAMQGSWKTVAGEAMGKPFPADGMPDFSFVTVADGKSTGKYGGSEWQFTMTINSNPKTIENSHHSVTCSPKTEPADMRVLEPEEGGKDFHEEEEA